MSGYWLVPWGARTDLEAGKPSWMRRAIMLVVFGRRWVERQEERVHG